jgi:hypothetical protein
MREMLRMKHELSFKMPQIFGKKENETPAERDERLEKRDENITKAIKVGGPIVLALTIGYLAGYNRGATQIQRHKGDLYIIK